MAEVGMHEAKTTLSRLVEQARAGEDVVLTRNGSPVARIVPVRTPSGLAAVMGAWEGRVRIAEDFDDAAALPEEWRDAFGLE